MPLIHVEISNKMFKKGLFWALCVASIFKEWILLFSTISHSGLHHRSRQGLAICFVLLVRQLTTACEASRQASDKQPKASVKHIESIWQTSAKHLTEVWQMICTCLSNAFYMLDRCFSHKKRVFSFVWVALKNESSPYCLQQTV